MSDGRARQPSLPVTAGDHLLADDLLADDLLAEELPAGDQPGPGPGPGPGQRQAPAGRPAHLRVVPPSSASPARRRRRVRLLAGLVGTFVIAVVFGLVWLHVMLAQNQFRLDRLDDEVTAAQSQYERSRLQVDQLESPQRIVDTAEGKLGMVVPSSVIYLTPSPAGSAPTAPSPASSVRSTPSAVRSTPSATLPGTPASTTVAVASGHAPTDWTSVKPLLVPHP